MGGYPHSEGGLRGHPPKNPLKNIPKILKKNFFLKIYFYIFNIFSSKILANKNIFHFLYIPICSSSRFLPKCMVFSLLSVLLGKKYKIYYLIIKYSKILYYTNFTTKFLFQLLSI